MTGPTNDAWPRVVLKDMTLGNVSIKKGDTIIFPLAGSNRLKSYWENGDVYNPKRWEASEGGVKTIAQMGLHQNAYAPFGTGRRGCIGKNFGELMVKLLLGNVVKKFDLEKVKGCEPEYCLGLTYNCANPLVRIKLRDSN